MSLTLVTFLPTIFQHSTATRMKISGIFLLAAMVCIVQAANIPKLQGTRMQFFLDEYVCIVKI